MSQTPTAAVPNYSIRGMLILMIDAAGLRRHDEIGRAPRVE